MERIKVICIGNDNGGYSYNNITIGKIYDAFIIAPYYGEPICKNCFDIIDDTGMIKYSGC